MNLSLHGKHALVGGSTQGIGLATAQALAQQGASVTLLARNADKLQEAIATLDKAQGQQHHWLVADFQQPAAVAAAVQVHVSSLSAPITILVNNTGGPPAGPIADAGADAFRQAFEQHVIVNQLLVQALLPGMKQAGMGRIINVISTSVKVPLAGLGVSNTIRAAVGNWAKTLANELGPYQITVNNVLPGATATERLAGIISHKAAKSGQTIEAITHHMQSEIPLQRFAEPQEVAAAIAFLASPAAAYISGINLPVDGGRTPNL